MGRFVYDIDRNGEIDSGDVQLVTKYLGNTP